MSSTRSIRPPPPLHLRPPAANSSLPDVGDRNFTILREIGDGSFGSVMLADWHSPLNLPPGTQPPGPSSRPEYRGKQLVAIKKMKKPFEGGWDECMKLKELSSLRTIPMHPFMIPLYDAFLHPSTRELYFVFECMEGNLYQLTKSRKGRPLAGGLIACIFEQILLGLHHVHSCGYFHRDMKPENLLITTTGLTDYPHGSPFALPTAPPERDVAVIVKIADFGLAREIESKPPYTEYVSTRWYRAPEILLRARDYSSPVDIWALGAIMVETVTLKPIFPGTSEMDQVERITSIMGDPKNNYGYDDKGRLRGGGQWLNGVVLAEAVGFQFSDQPPMDFVQLFDISSIPIQLVDCLHELLRYNPTGRLTTAQCLNHSYFTDIATRLIPPSLSGIAKVNQSSSLANTPPSPPSSGINNTNHMNNHSSNNGLDTTPPHNHPHSTYMAVDLPAISPQVVPTSHTQFPHARPTHALTPSSSTATDSVMSDVDHHHPHQHRHQHHHHPSHQQQHPHHHPQQTSNDHLSSSQSFPPTNQLGAAPYLSQHELHQRGPQPYESYAAPHSAHQVYSYPTPNDPSFLSLPSAVLSSSAQRSVPLQHEASHHSSSHHHNGSTSQSSSLKSRSRTLASVFTSGSQSLKRSPSDRATASHSTEAATNTSSPHPPTQMDPKKAKKEAEKAAKEEAKLEQQAKREAARRSAQERSRAVLQKQRLAQGSDILIHVNPEFAPPLIGGGVPSARKTIEKGKGRAVLHSPLPQIVEDCSRLRQNRFGSGNESGSSSFQESLAESMRRANNESRIVQEQESYYSSEFGTDPKAMGGYREEDRRFSFNSSNTMDSDPGPGGGAGMKLGGGTGGPGGAGGGANGRSRSIGSSGISRLSVASSPNLASLYRSSTPASTTSSLDHQLVSNMAGLTANERQLPAHLQRHWSNQSMDENSGGAGSNRRSRSPSDPRFSPYGIPTNVNGNNRPSLPGISNFDFNNEKTSTSSSSPTSLRENNRRKPSIGLGFISDPNHHQQQQHRLVVGVSGGQSGSNNNQCCCCNNQYGAHEEGYCGHPTGGAPGADG